MTNNQQPRPNDAVLSDFTPDISTSPVLGGLEGTVLNFTSNLESVKMASLQKAVLYGEKGLDLILQGLDDPILVVQKEAYLLLKDRSESRVIERLKSFVYYPSFECLWTSKYTGVFSCIVLTPDDKTFFRGACENSMAISPDGQTYVSITRTIRVHNFQTGEWLYLEGHTNIILCIAITPDSKTIVSGSRDKTIKIWNINTGECLNTLKGHSHYVQSIAISPDGKTLTSGSYDKKIKIWDLTTGDCLHTLQGHLEDVKSIAISQNGKTIVSGSDDKTIKIWGIPE